MLVVAGVPHAGRRLLRHAQEEPERVDVFAEHRFVTEVRGNLGEARQEFIHRHRGAHGPGAFLQVR